MLDAYTIFEVSKQMFELTLCLNYERQNYLNDFYKSIIFEVKKNSGIVVKQNYHGKCYVAFAIDDDKKEYLKSRVLDFVTWVIIDDFKYNYFKNIIPVSEEIKLTEAFFKAISLFDQEVDKEIIASSIEFSGEIIIESLFYFKLQALKDRWNRTAKIINLNGIISSEKSMIDVLRYLCCVSENSAVYVDVTVSKRQIELKNYSRFKRFKLGFDGMSDFFTEIIKLNPIKINIKNCGKSNNFNEISTILSNVFEDKIYFI